MSDRLPAVTFPGGPCEIPAQEALQFNDAFLSQIIVDAATGQTTFRWRRYNYASNRVMSDLESQLLGVPSETLTRVESLWTEAANYPLVAQVAGGLLMVAGAMAALIPARATLAAAQVARAAVPEGEDVTEAQAALEAAQAAVSAIEAQLGKV